MLDYILELFGSAQFVPHAVCLLWRPDLLLMHGVSDFLISVSYFTIPIIIIKAVKIRPDLMDPSVARLFAAFITACALSHLSGLITLWVPAYGIQGVIKMATAAVSIYTAIQLARLLPMFLTMPSRTDLASKVAEVAIEQQKAIEAKEARDKLSEFAFIASHDLKAPLRGIANQARFLIEDHGDAIDPDARRRLNRMQDLCGHLEMLISTLLKYSRIGRSDAQQDLDPGEMVTGIVSSLSEFISDQNGEVVIETDLPLISADPSDLNTVFQNLIVNGLTYNESEEKRIWIGYLDEKTVDSVGMQDVFYVRDNGIGIAADFHDDVFRMFKRLNQPDAYQGGSGAGLAFVKKVIESNGGIIKLSSVPGHGTTFYFSFSKRPAAQKTSASVKLGRAEHA